MKSATKRNEKKIRKKGRKEDRKERGEAVEALKRNKNGKKSGAKGVGSFFKKVYKYRAFLLMLLPAVIYTLVFAYYPMTGIVLAFKKYTYAGGIWGSAWNGIENLFKIRKLPRTGSRRRFLPRAIWGWYCRRMYI